MDFDELFDLAIRETVAKPHPASMPLPDDISEDDVKNYRLMLDFSKNLLTNYHALLKNALAGQGIHIP